MYACVCFLILWAFTRTCISGTTGKGGVSAAWECSLMHAENNPLHVLISSPWTCHRARRLVELLQNLLVSSNWSCLEGQWETEEGAVVSWGFFYLLVWRRKDVVQRYWPGLGRERVTDHLLGVEYHSVSIKIILLRICLGLLLVSFRLTYHWITCDLINNMEIQNNLSASF